MTMKTAADAVVIGSGVSGALVAQRLAEAKCRVILLEAGETGSPRAALVGKYVTASVKSMGAPYKGTEADRIVPSPDGANDPYLHQPDGANFKATYQRRVGGSTWHWRGNVPRFLPNDFRLRSLYGVGIDWPITYRDLEEDYCKAERELGVSGNHEEWQNYKGAWRSQSFPMSEIWSSYGDSVVAPTINDLVVEGVRLRVTRTPQARNSQPYDGRPACAGNSTCDPICPIGAKYDATSHVAKAVQAGAILYEKCVATRLVVEPSRLISAVNYLTWDGEEHSIATGLVIVAAHAIETPKLLLLSACEHAPNGVANSSDFVGRCLMDHLQGQGAALLNTPVFPFRGPPTTSGIDDFRDGPFRATHSAFRMSVGNDGWGLVEGPYTTLVNMVRRSEKPLYGQALRVALRDRLSRQFRISYSTETLPDPDNRIDLSPTEIDALRVPKPRIRFRPSEYNLRAFAAGRRVITAIFAALQTSEEPRFNSDPHAYSSANHIIGTTRMGLDPKTSVTDPYGRTHDHPNLFIAGCSLFPTCGTANPTLTSVAITLRSIPAIKSALGKFTP